MYSLVDVDVRKSPHSGSLDVIPTEGLAFFDLFDLRAANWLGDELPFDYEFRIGPSAFSDEGAVLQAASNASAALDSRLPAGLPNVTLTVIVIDALGAQGTADGVARVVADSEVSSESDFNEVLSEALADAFEEESFDSVCQVIMASMPYVRGDATVLESLIRTHDESFKAFVDTTSLSELTQTASTLLYLMDEPDVLPEDAAETALELISNVTMHVEEVGIGSSNSTVPTVILDVVSSILESVLFSTIIAQNTEAADTLLGTIESLTAAQRNTLIYNEESVQANAEFVRTYDVSLTEFKINPFNTISGSVASSDTLRFYFTARDEFDIDLEYNETTVTLDVAGRNTLDDATFSNETVTATWHDEPLALLRWRSQFCRVFVQRVTVGVCDLE
ncbi:hypothetical protein CTAYLR_006206 [Chrysophaeum taylorii]|uniref:PKD/REJ-like domain-containing protein n=1 Tax=Chrysophaeum taylorii TaxID=2483200 RepID=A0AAD7U6L4_9STRA|nr:hypothetical protein CTAYLR_006206 [Chrysophaeum taylorii]